MSLLLAGDFKNPILIYQFLWWSALVCFTMASSAAWRVRSHLPLFIAAALFATVWVLVAASSGGRLDAVAKAAAQGGKVPRDSSEILVADRAIDVASFLLVLVGVLLSKERPEGHWANRLHAWLLPIAFLVLIVLVRPNYLLGPLFGADEIQRDLGVGEVLGAIGFVCLTIGVLAVGATWQKIAIVFAMVAWQIVSADRLMELIVTNNEGTRNPVSSLKGYSFVVLRLLATFIVTRAVRQAYDDWAQRGMKSIVP